MFNVMLCVLFLFVLFLFILFCVGVDLDVFLMSVVDNYYWWVCVVGCCV